MVIKSRKFAEIREEEISKISLALATSEDIKEWSHGEVISPETINYKTYKPEKGGLFDEVIFGPTTDFKCPICATKYKRSNMGQICEKTDECKQVKPEILQSKTRRTRMGHIELASPVVHFWFFKIDNSILSKLLGLRPSNSKKMHTKATIENIIYFKAHIVLEDGGLKSLPKNEIIDINNAPVVYRNALIEVQKNHKEGTEAFNEIQFVIEELEETATSKIGKDYGIDFYELNEIIEEYSNAKIGTGAKAIEYILENFDIKAEARRVKTDITKLNKELSSSAKISTGKIDTRKKLYKRLEVITSFLESDQDLNSMLMYSLPVLPADLRPLIQIDGGRHSTTDVNELYRRIIIRNNRLKKWIDLDAPILIKQNELRMLQEAVDALIDNTRKKPSPVLSKDNRPLKSISDSLSGKKGRFRQNLLGKRVDYSGRSVIVVGPKLKMHQVGIPRNMAAKLFEPWIIAKLIKASTAPSVKLAKKMIEEQNNVIWPFVEKAIEGKVVLLNRAPTLHRLSIQAFEPVLVRGKAIKLHALVTTAFNADFDGDQMAVHVPISNNAIREAKELMLANKNILGPKDGEPIINPSQDMILGLYYLTKEKKSAKGEGHVFASYEEMYKAYDLNYIDLHARIALPTEKVGKEYLATKKGYVVSTVGKFIFNNAFPKNFPFIFDNSVKTLKENYNKFIVKPGEDVRKFIEELELNEALDKKDIAKIARQVFDQYNASISKEDLASIVKKVNTNTYLDTLMLFSELKDYKGDVLDIIHAQTLSALVKEHFQRLNKRIALSNEGRARVFEVTERVELLEAIWFDYTNSVASTLDNIKQLGFTYSMISGTTMSIDDIKQSNVKDSLVKEADKYINELKKKLEKGFITDDEKYQHTIKKWAEVKNIVQDDLKKLTEENEDNPIFAMMKSGARGNISNFVQLAGLRGLMANNKKAKKGAIEAGRLVRSTIDVPVKSSFLEGLTAYEFYSSTHGARKGLTDTALNTAQAGYLTRTLVDASQNIIIKEDDCNTEQGSLIRHIIDTKTKTIIVDLEERIEGRFALLPVIDSKGNEIISQGQYITPALAAAVVKAKVESVMIRSIFGCQTIDGVCRTCYGKDLATNRIVAIGEPVGIVAAQSIGEPGTQLTMRTFHTGGVAGVSDITGGFDRLKQLIYAWEPWGKSAIISRTGGEVLNVSVKDTLDDEFKGEEITYISNKKISARDKLAQRTVVLVRSSDKEGTLYGYWSPGVNRLVRVKKGDIVKPGSKIIQGPIDLRELLDVAGTIGVQKYLLKEIQKLYRLQGISISDKYVELIVRQMLSKVVIQEPGDSKFYTGQLVDLLQYKAENTKIILRGKTPAYGSVEIIGVKALPLLSKSFLAAASYQETAKVLVHSSIKRKQDNLEGFKENIIVGHKIPAGTNFNIDKKGKFDIRDPYTYFGKKK